MSQEAKLSEPGLISEETVVNAFSAQPTTMVETTFAETLGLSMHNAVLSQLNAQMVTQASITNACARLLTIPSRSFPKRGEESQNNQTEEAIVLAKPEPSNLSNAEQPKKLSIANFFNGNKGHVDKRSEENNTGNPSNNDGI